MSLPQVIAAACQLVIGHGSAASACFSAFFNIKLGFSPLTKKVKSMFSLPGSLNSLYKEALVYC